MKATESSAEESRHPQAAAGAAGGGEPKRPPPPPPLPPPTPTPPPPPPPPPPALDQTECSKAAVGSRNADAKEQANGEASYVEKSAALKSACPAPKFSRTKFRKQMLGNGMVMNRDLIQLKAGLAAAAAAAAAASSVKEHLSHPGYADYKHVNPAELEAAPCGRDGKACGKSGLTPMTKEALLEKASARHDSPVGDGAPCKGGIPPRLEQQPAADKAEHAIPKLDKQPSTNCTSADHRTAPSADIYGRRSAGADGPITVPSPAAPALSLNRIAAFPPPLPPQPACAQAETDRVSVTPDADAKPAVASQPLPLHFSFKLHPHNFRMDSAPAKSGLHPPRLHSVKAFAQLAERSRDLPCSAAHKMDVGAVASFKSLLNSKPTLKPSVLKMAHQLQRTYHSCSLPSPQTLQPKLVNKRKGKSPRMKVVVSSTAGAFGERLASPVATPGLLKPATYRPEQKIHSDHPPMMRSPGFPSMFSESKIIKARLPKLTKACISPPLPQKPEGPRHFVSPQGHHEERVSKNSLQDPPLLSGVLNVHKPKKARAKLDPMPQLEQPPHRTLKIPPSKVLSMMSKNKEFVGEKDPPILQPETQIVPGKVFVTSLPGKRRRGRPKKQLQQQQLTMMTPAAKPMVPAAADRVGDPEEEATHHRGLEPSEMKAKPTEYPQKPTAGDDYQTAGEADPKSSKKGKRQLMKTLLDKKFIKKINKMKTLKRKKLLNQILLSAGGSSGKGKVQSKMSSTISTFTATFGSKVGQQINVSKKGTIYIGKKRGRKPKMSLDGPYISSMLSMDSKPLPPAFTTTLGQMPPNFTQSAVPDVLPSPTYSQSSGVSGSQSPASSDAGFIEPTPVLNLHPHGSKGSGAPQTLAGRKASKGRRKLSPPTLLPNSPSHLCELTSLKEATPSPISESHSEETIPSDSGIGTDNNSTSDRAEKFCGPRKRRYSFDHVSVMPAESAAVLSSLKEKHKHKCKRRAHDYLSYDKLKRQKRKRKKKYLQLRNKQDPNFLAELEELITRLSELRITHRSHHYIPRDILPSIFRINFGSFYTHPPFPFDPMHYVRKPELKKKRGRPPKMREAMTEVPFVHGLSFPLANGGFFPSYSMPYSPTAVSAGPLGLGYYARYPPTLYPPPPPPPPPSLSGTMPPPSYMHAGHLLLNPNKYHKKKHRLLRPEAFLAGSRTSLLSMGTYASIPAEMAYSWMHEHKHKHRHKHREHRSSEQGPPGSVDGLAVGPSLLRRYAYGKASDMSDRHKHKDKHRCHMPFTHLASSKGLLGRGDQWARRDSTEHGSISVGLQTPLQIDCAEGSAASCVARYLSGSEASVGEEHTNLFTSAIGSYKPSKPSSGAGRKKLPDGPDLLAAQDSLPSRLLRWERPSPGERTALTAAGRNDWMGNI
ncbi:histone-lysine N-methyltransferase ASH1L-like [Amblyraja radiata]|uniref:histone-lysine N-methyltransferase ASH1L-like n=1 Tax=Amblyraja radiata TaxID=386614 RepID=UPI001403E4F3|nr:histone-lysine N-methyltransferase ASH1L-like [Amblyraja radiata]